jgi:hypothetical protein
MKASPADVVATENAAADDNRSTNQHSASSSTIASSWRRGVCRNAPSAGSVRTRTAPRLAVVNRYASVNTSTGSSTSGVDVSVSSSRSELIGLMRNGLTPTATTMMSTGLSSTTVAVAASSVDADCEDNVDEDDTLSIYRSASFRRAIERGNSPGCGSWTSAGGVPLPGPSGLSTASSKVSSSGSYSSTGAAHVTSAPVRAPSPRASSLVKQSSNVVDTEPYDVLDLSLAGTTVSTERDRNSFAKIVLVGSDSGAASTSVTHQECVRQIGDDLDDIYSNLDAFSDGTEGLTTSYGFVHSEFVPDSNETNWLNELAAFRQLHCTPFAFYTALVIPVKQGYIVGEAAC